MTLTVPIPVSCDLQLATFPHETNGEYLRAYKRITVKGGDCHRPCLLLLRVLSASVCAFPFVRGVCRLTVALSSTGSGCSVEIRTQTDLCPPAALYTVRGVAAIRPSMFSRSSSYF